MNAPEMTEDSMRLSVRTAPTTHALAHLMAVLHSRRANILDLSWRISPADREGVATLLIGLDSARQRHLQAAISRLVEVRSVLIHDR